MATMLNDELKKLARAGIEAEIARLQKLLSALSNDSGTPRAISKPKEEPPEASPRRQMSPEARKAISKRMKARWAKLRKAQV
jgi:hypothetical protein